MSKISVEINPITNYIFHMLSVAGLGYDNDYGRRWRHTLPESDIAVLKKHERQLTVKGGKHCGEWYGQLVCEAAKGDMLPEKYYADMDDPDMAEVCRVLGRHYQEYLQAVYPESLRELEPYAAQLQQLLDESDLADRAEAMIGQAQPRCRFGLLHCSKRSVR